MSPIALAVCLGLIAMVESILKHPDACSSCGLLPGFPVVLVIGAFNGHHCILPHDNLYRSARQASIMNLLASSRILKSKSYLPFLRTLRSPTSMSMTTGSV